MALSRLPQLVTAWQGRKARRSIAHRGWKSSYNLIVSPDSFDKCAQAETSSENADSSAFLMGPAKSFILSLCKQCTVDWYRDCTFDLR